jgi:hypothetical protein
MTKDLDTTDDQEATTEQVGDALKEWLKAGDKEDAPAVPAEDDGDTAADGATGDQDAHTEGDQEPQDGTVEPAPQEDMADSPEVAEEPENASQEDTSEEDTLQQKYAALEAKLAELEAREAARIEAEQKTNALNAAGIKGRYGELLTGSPDTWNAQIDLLKQFAAENAPAISVPRDPAVDADLFAEDKELTADEFLRGHSDVI